MIVVEKYLGVANGHEHTIPRAIEALAPDSNRLYVTGLDYEQGSLSGVSVKAILSTRRDHKKRPQWSVQHDTQKLKELILDCAGKRPPSVLIPTAHVHDVRICLELLDELPDGVIFYLRFLSEHHIQGLDESEYKRLRTAIADKQLVLVTETSYLADHLLSCYGMQSEDCLLLPVTLLRATHADNGLSSDKGTTRPLRVGYLGGPRKEKGGDLIPDIIKQLRVKCARDAPGLTVEFVMQKPKTRMRLRSLRYQFALYCGARFGLWSKNFLVKFLPPDLDSKAFQRVLESVDVLLLPYNDQAYRNRGSGIIIDGVMAHKPLVHTAGMKMSDLLDHGNAERSEQAAVSYADKVVNVLINLKDYDAPTRKAADALQVHIRRSAEFLRSI